MKKHLTFKTTWLSFTAVLFVFLAVQMFASSGKAEGKKTDEKIEKSRFLIISPHTPEQCLLSLDNYVEKDPELLKKFDWGCMDGDHTGYLIIDAPSEKSAQQILPADEQKTVRIIKLNKFTVEQIKEFHKKM